jgi:uncharacterized protein HemY
LEPTAVAVLLSRDINLASPGGWNYLAWMLATGPQVGLRDPARAVQLAKKAVHKEPTEGRYWNTLGVAHYRAGDWKAAAAALEKSMALRQGGDGYDWFFLAMVHWKLDHKKEARRWYDKAAAWLKEDPKRQKNDELRGFQAEARALLGLQD